MGHLKFFKKDNPQLFRRIDIKFFPGQLIDFLLKLPDPRPQLVAVDLQGLSFYLYARLLHLVKSKYKGHFDFPEKPVHPFFF